MPGFELIGQEEQTEINEVFSKGGVLFRHSFDAIRNGCYKVKQFEENFAKHHKVPYALALSSGTASLRVALAAIGIERGDEVITQSFTFVATVEAIIEAGANPVCTEIDKTLNMDVEDLKRKITNRTKAVIAVHMLGTPANLLEIKKICKENNILLIEDTAWGLGGELNKQKLGAIGDIGCFSFDHAKALTTGEGGMLITNNEEIWSKAAAWHDHGHENNPSVPRWEDTRSSSGFNFRMSELQGAVGCAQLRKLNRVIDKQRENCIELSRYLKEIEWIKMREEPVGSKSTYDAIVFSVPNKNIALLCRDALLNSGFGTKILPEAISWHFAGHWSHMTELVSSHRSMQETAELKFKSQVHLSSAVAIPNNLNLSTDDLLGISATLKKLGNG